MPRAFVSGRCDHAFTYRFFSSSRRSANRARSASSGFAIRPPSHLWQGGGVVTQRRAAAVTGLVLLAAFIVALVVTTPWHPLPGHVPGGQVPPDANRDFTAAQIARETAYHSALRPWGYLEIA